MINQIKDKKVIFFDVGYTLDMPASGDWMFTGKFLELAGGKLKQHSDAEINAAKRHLEELDGQQVAAENLEEVIRLIRQSRDPKDACSRLEKRFEIGYIKAKYILNLPLTQLSSSTIVSTSIEKEDYKLRLEFLQKLL